MSNMMQGCHFLCFSHSYFKCFVKCVSVLRQLFKGNVIDPASKMARKYSGGMNISRYKLQVNYNLKIEQCIQSSYYISKQEINSLVIGFQKGSI